MSIRSKLFLAAAFAYLLACHVQADGISNGSTRDRSPVSSPVTYFVSTSGNDSNNGLTAGTPFRTIQQAVNVVTQTLNVRGVQVTIQLADGTYNEEVFVGSTTGYGSPTVGPTVTIKGNCTTPTNVVISPSAVVNGYTTRFYGAGQWVIQCLRLTNDTKLLWADHYSIVYFDQVDFQFNANVTTGIEVDNYSIVADTLTNVFTISNSGGTPANFINAAGPATTAYIFFATMTVNQAVAFSNAFLAGSLYSDIQTSSLTVVNAGNITGPRFNISLFSYMNTPAGDGNLTALPGNSAGTMDGTSVYDNASGISTVANLPTCNASRLGAPQYVTDATGPTFLATVVGGGTVKTTVHCNGTNWVSD